MALIALVPLPSKTPFAVSVLVPIPPWTTLRAVVRPDREVMSLLAPLAAALMFDRAPPAVVAPVPPLASDRAVPRLKALKVGLALLLMS